MAAHIAWFVCLLLWIILQIYDRKIKNSGDDFERLFIWSLQAILVLGQIIFLGLAQGWW